MKLKSKLLNDISKVLDDYWYNDNADTNNLERKVMEIVNIHRKKYDKQHKMMIDFGFPQKIKRDRHGRFTHYMTVDQKISLFIGTVLLLLIVLGFLV
jgi:hypothetical protein